MFQNRQQTSKLKEMQQKAAMLCQHVSSEYLPAHTLYQPPKWCSKCNIKIVSEAVLMAHMLKRHQKSSQDEVRFLKFTIGAIPIDMFRQSFIPYLWL